MTLVNKLLAVITINNRFSEAEFLDVIGTKVLRAFLLDIHSHLYYGILPPHPPLPAKVV
jgi:hypothetical protein